jgi:N utilization substance protein B
VSTPEAPSPSNGPARGARRRSAARLAAVQALFQIDFAAVTSDDVIAEFAVYRLKGDLDGEAIVAAERNWFETLVAGVDAERSALDEKIAPLLGENWSLDRLGGVQRAVLRAAAYELMSHPKVPARVVISEYVDLAGAFSGGEEVSFVNAVLDRLARELRGNEFETAGP